jgi:aminopeptidase YwaD
VGRTLQRLISQGALPRPARTIRFIWPPEVEGTVTLLNARPEFAHRIKVAIHMDMVGGNPDTKSVFHVTRGPMSLPSFVHDVAWAFAAWVNDETYRFAATGKSEYPLIAPEGGKEPLRAEYSRFEMGSDHQVYQDSSFGIPAIYFNDWPDRYIHTNLDAVSNIDPTKLKRVALIGAASAYFLANFSAQDRPAVLQAVEVGRLMRTVATLQKGAAGATGSNMASAATIVLSTPQEEYERGVIASLNAFDNPPPSHSEPVANSDGTPVFRRRAEPKGPLAVFGYDYFEDHARAAGIATPRLLGYTGDGKSGEDEEGYAYEALNFADGKRSARQIAECLSTEYGSVPTELVVEYLEALKKIGVVD